MTNSYTHIQQTGVFADPINIYKLNRKFTNKELNFVKAVEKKAVRNATNKSSFDKYILNKPALNGLKNFVQDCLNHYLLDIYNPVDAINIYITQSWLNYTKQGESHHSHRHENSIVSGVLYIKTDAEDQILFENDVYKFFDIIPIKKAIEMAITLGLVNSTRLFS